MIGKAYDIVTYYIVTYHIAPPTGQNVTYSNPSPRTLLHITGIVTGDYDAARITNGTY